MTDLKVVRKNPVSGSQLDGIYAVTPGGVKFLSNCQPEVVTVASFKMDALLPLTAADSKAIAAKPPRSAKTAVAAEP